MRIARSACPRLLCSAFALALALLLALGARAAAPASADAFSARELAQGYSDRVILAKPHPHHRATVDAAEAREQVRVRERFARFGDLRVITLAPDESVRGAIARLQATGRYEFVEPDYLMAEQVIPNDPGFANQWGLSNTGFQLSGSTPR